MIGNQIWSHQSDVFENQIKYVLIINHHDKNSNGPCVDNYCVLTQDGATWNPVSYFNTQPIDLFSSPATVSERLKGLKGPLTNSGDILIILKSVGNTPGYSPGYNFSGPDYMTEHGSLSDFESNTPFAVFYPYGTPNVISRIPSFINTYFAPLPTPQTRLSTQLKPFFVSIVSKSNEIFMPQ